MDEDEGNALEEFSAELEEHLYAKIHHEPVESAPRAEAPRVVAAGGQKGRNGRYFGVGGVAGKSGWKKFGKKSAPILGIDKEVTPVGGRPAVRFTPYESFLEGIKVTSNAVKTGNPGNLRKNPARLFRKPQDVPPEAPKVSSKRERAKKNRRKDKKKLHTIVLDSSEDEKDDDVVEVPVPPPPLVCLDSSDESEAPRKVPRVAQRGSSPSSSILSDDFIAAQDRRRLEALDVVHVADEELRTVQQQSKSPTKRQAPLSDISTSDSEDFLPDGDSAPKRHFQKRQCRPQSPKETPYIHRGEALPSAVTLPRKSIDTTSSHRSDEEFMTILSTIANGEASNEPLEIPDSPEEVHTDIVINIERCEETPEPQDDLPESDGSEEEEEETPDQEEEPPKLLHGWNEEMRRFYEESWGGEKFSVQNIIRQMPDNNQWQISARDFNYSRFHRTWREPQELKLVCYMCGDSGHREPRCPNTLCLKCGNRTMVFGIACSKCADWSSGQCDVCHTHGHKSELCPDLWRRYHSTVDDAAPVEHPGALNERKCCSICAKQGHTADSCPSPVRILEYPASPWKVYSYEAVYETTDKVVNAPDPFHTYRGERARFVWSDNVQRAQFYERFLRHCGVERSGEEAKVEEAEEMIEVEPEAPSVIQKDNAESKIVLHRDYCSHLMARYGRQFLRKLADELCVEVNLRTSGEGNLLTLRGEKSHMADFRQRLMHFLTMQTRRKADLEAQKEGVPCLPQNRLKMIQVVRSNVARLTRYIGDAREIFREMRLLEKDPDRVSGANDARAQLNMILLGQVGLKPGRDRLRALEADLTMLEKQQGPEVPLALRNSINGHFRCIFTSFIHDNYDRKMKQFNKMKKHRVLPAVAVPRREGWRRGRRH